MTRQYDTKYKKLKKMKNSKAVNIMFFAAGVLLWFLAFHYVGQWVGYFQLARRIGAESADGIKLGLPIVVGLATFIILRTNTKATYFVSDCMDELFRVVFPGSREVKIGTLWVIVLVILAGVFFGGLDWAITKVVKSIIGIKS